MSKVELLSWNSPTVHVCCFMLARASTETFVSRVQKTAKKIFVSPKNSLAGSLVSRGITVFVCIFIASHKHSLSLHSHKIKRAFRYTKYICVKFYHSGYPILANHYSMIIHQSIIYVLLL